jgi:hypothetical protein
MQLAHQRKEATSIAPAAASHQVSNPFTLAGEHTDSSGDSTRLVALRLQLARYGLSACTLSGKELLLTGPGTSRLAPDIRSAWMYLRQLDGRMA